jgi:RNA polymerase sigma-70 factor (ECF subfamily)
MRKICKGSHPAFTELVRRHTDQFYALSFRTLQNHGDAEDIVQKAFINLWQNPHAWKAEKSKFTTWFYRVILNACHDFRRKHKRNSLADVETIARALKPTDSEQVLLELKQHELDKAYRLQSALAELPAAQKDALNLVIYCALPQKQAAEIMGLSLKALESSLIRAKRSLAKKLAENSHVPAASGRQAKQRSYRIK